MKWTTNQTDRLSMSGLSVKLTKDGSQKEIYYVVLNIKGGTKKKKIECSSQQPDTYQFSK